MPQTRPACPPPFAPPDRRAAAAAQQQRACPLKQQHLMGTVRQSLGIGKPAASAAVMGLLQQAQTWLQMGAQQAVQPVRCFEAALAAASPSLSLSANAAANLGFAVPRPKASLGAVPDLLLMPPRERPKPLPPMAAGKLHCDSALSSCCSHSMGLDFDSCAISRSDKGTAAPHDSDHRTVTSPASIELRDMRCKVL